MHNNGCFPFTSVWNPFRQRQNSDVHHRLQPVQQICLNVTVDPPSSGYPRWTAIHLAMPTIQCLQDAVFSCGAFSFSSWTLKFQYIHPIHRVLVLLATDFDFDFALRSSHSASALCVFVEQLHVMVPANHMRHTTYSSAMQLHTSIPSGARVHPTPTHSVVSDPYSANVGAISNPQPSHNFTYYSAQPQSSEFLPSTGAPSLVDSRDFHFPVSNNFQEEIFSPAQFNPPQPGTQSSLCVEVDSMDQMCSEDLPMPLAWQSPAVLVESASIDTHLHEPMPSGFLVEPEAVVQAATMDVVKSWTLRSEAELGMEAKEVVVRLREPEEGAECPITLGPVCASELDFMPGVQFFEDQPSWKQMDLNCGHSFAAMPLVFAWMAGQMRCPLCRAGCKPLAQSLEHWTGVSERLDGESLPSHLQPQLQQRMRQLRRASREDLDSESMGLMLEVLRRITGGVLVHHTRSGREAVILVIAPPRARGFGSDSGTDAGLVVLVYGDDADDTANDGTALLENPSGAAR